MTSNNYDCTCKQCLGNKVIPALPVTQMVCPDCSGEGQIDWVTTAMSRKQPAQRLVYNIAMKNIQMLVEEIKRQASMFDKDVLVKLEFKAYSHNYYPMPYTHHIDYKEKPHV